MPAFSGWWSARVGRDGDEWRLSGPVQAENEAGSIRVAGLLNRRLQLRNGQVDLLESTGELVTVIPIRELELVEPEAPPFLELNEELVAYRAGIRHLKTFETAVAHDRFRLVRWRAGDELPKDFPGALRKILNRKAGAN